MLTFLLGLIFGAILGVAADRIWQRVERRPRFKIKPAYYESIRPAPIKGIEYQITNVGPREVPDYDIALFHPRRGSLLAFDCEESGQQIPKEIRRHWCVLLKQGTPCQSRSWYFHENDKPVKQVTFEGFRFRLVMKNSDRILFESERIGNTLAKVIVRMFESSGARQWTWEEGLSMSTPPPWSKRVRRLIRKKGTQFIASLRMWSENLRSRIDAARR